MQTVDSRHAFVVRNWYESLVSGYLYHKDGQECNNVVTETREWEDHIRFNHPPGLNRSICEYLVDESLTNGLQVYMEWALNFHYKGLLDTWKEFVMDDETRVTYFCYENLLPSNPESDENFAELTRFLFPGGYSFPTPTTPTLMRAHTTTKNSTIRNHIRRLAKDLDSRLFHDAYHELQATFGCG
jgi:hypothetical protein